MRLKTEYSPTLPPSDAKSICKGESLMELLSTPLDGAGDGDRDPEPWT